MRKRVLHLDFETFSWADIRTAGLDNYLRNPQTCVTVCAWAFDDDPVQSIVWPATKDLPEEVYRHILALGEVRAHNAGFEHAVLHHLYGLNPTVEQMVCTMQKALSYGLPAGLLKAGRALKLPIVKDESKRLLMLAMGRPRPLDKNGRRVKPWHEADPLKLAALRAYCEDDVAAERCLDGAVPDLHPWEKKLSELDAQINQKGVKLDWAAIDALDDAAEAALAAINAECTALTGGTVTKPGSQTQKLMDWLETEGCPLADVSKETIEAALSNPAAIYHDPTVRRVLQLRQMAARSSVAKLERMHAVMSTTDHRARHLLQFAGAGRTLRWAGRLIQPQNLPRSAGVDAEQVIGTATLDPGALGLLWGDPMAAISRSLRSCFIAADDHVLVSVDLSQIEARVLAWVAGQTDVLDAFRKYDRTKNKVDDAYSLAAAKVGSHDRQLGKVLTLACGYGMGWAKFKDTAAKAPYYIDLSDDEAKLHLRTWRNANPMIISLWGQVEQAFRNSISIPGIVFDLPRGMAVRTVGGTTQVRKPNGVRLTYHNMRFWQGDLIFDGVNSTTKNWGIEKAYGGRLVENLVQSIARDVMAEAMLRAEHAAVPVMTVHDEIVWEVPADKSLFFQQGDCYMAPEDTLKRTVEYWPAWARDLPIASEVHVGRRYAK